MTDFQSEINARVDAFVADITEMARQAAHEALSSALAQAGASSGGARRAAAVPRARGKGAKRTPEELASMADSFLEYISTQPGQRMEQISKALGYTTTELNLPVKKLLQANKIRVEGQKRATQYYPAESGSSSSSKRSKSRRRSTKGRRKKAA
ncbi:DNA-binding protein [Haliangium sp.]|uniref:DNA-binding protein n=1 Tax=Haliangium sp. TaxID=2663208 RepID=UPI003D09632E